MKFTQREIKDLLFAWILISLAFAILLSGGTRSFTNPTIFLISLIISALTAGIGFLLHELMHKYVAQSYKLQAEFFAFYKMLFLAIALSFLGFIFAAPGAVFIKGKITPEKNGKISLAGPLTNIILAVLFLALLITIETESILSLFFRYGFIINALLGAFNLIPVPPFDGYKVFDWNKAVYFTFAIIAIALFVLIYYV